MHYPDTPRHHFVVPKTEILSDPSVATHTQQILDTWHQNVSSYFDETFDFIEAHRGKGSVLVHCRYVRIDGFGVRACLYQLFPVAGLLNMLLTLFSLSGVRSAGISRSPTIVMAYLMKKNNWTLDRTYSHVRQSRGIISPNLVRLDLCRPALFPDFASTSPSGVTSHLAPPPPPPSTHRISWAICTNSNACLEK
jgi:hypothetical protein